MGTAISRKDHMTITAMYNWGNPCYGKGCNVEYMTWPSLPFIILKTVKVWLVSIIHDMFDAAMYHWENPGYGKGNNLQCMT